MELSNKTFLITGGATGIGLALATALYKKGSKIKICGRRKERLEQVKELFPEIDILVCDLSYKAQRIELYEWATSDGRLDVLVNNAGTQRTFLYNESHVEDYDSGDNEIEINLMAPIHLCELFIPFLMKNESAAIVNISSSLAIVHEISFPVYCASKAAIHTFTRCLREQLANSSVKVFGLIPPAVTSEINPEGRAVKPPPVLMPTDEYAAYVIKGLEADIYEINPANFAERENKSLKELYEYFKNPNNPR